jgi:DNA-directed RNA polymerase specialized sigma24 family protein
MDERIDLDTSAGQEKLEQIFSAVKRRIRRRVFSDADADDLIQESYLRVLKNARENENLTITENYCIRVSTFVLHEHWRKIRSDQQRIYQPHIQPDDGAENPEPIDSAAQLANFGDEKLRDAELACFLECFEQRKEADQILLWRYSYDKNLEISSIDIESHSERFFASLFENLRETIKKFAPFQKNYAGMTNEEKNNTTRTKVRRIRIELWDCFKSCLERKKTNI